MRRLAIAARARVSLADIEAYLLERADEDTASGFIDKIIQRCERIASLPGTLGTGRPHLDEDLRSTPHKGYIIYFRYVGDDLLQIVSVLDARRDALAYFTPDEEA